MYDEAAVEALQEVRRVIEPLGPGILFRKFYGVLNAIEVQIEDGAYRPEALVRLAEALLETAIFYGVDPTVQSQLTQAFVAFMRRLERLRQTRQL